MAESTLWWLAAGALIAVELVTGTFYLLMLSTGLAAAALSAHLGLPSAGQWVVAALVGGSSVLVWWRIKRARGAPPRATANRDVNLDIGAVVQVDVWRPDGSCSVKYRGAQWEAQLSPGAVATPGSYTVAEVVGSRLILQHARNP